MDPELVVDRDLLFEQRHLALQAIYSVLDGSKGLLAVAREHDDEDDVLAVADDAGPVVKPDLVDALAGLEFLPDRVQPPVGHAVVLLELEGLRPGVVRGVLRPNSAGESRDGARAFGPWRALDLADERLEGLAGFVALYGVGDRGRIELSRTGDRRDRLALRVCVADDDGRLGQRGDADDDGVRAVGRERVEGLVDREAGAGGEPVAVGAELVGDVAAGGRPRLGHVEPVGDRRVVADDADPAPTAELGDEPVETAFYGLLAGTAVENPEHVHVPTDARAGLLAVARHRSLLGALASVADQLATLKRGSGLHRGSMKVVVSIGGSVLVPDLGSDRVAEHAAVVEDLLEDGCRVGCVVGGGGVAREYIGAARDLGANEIELDQLGIDVTRLNARLLIAALGEDAATAPALDYEEAGDALRGGDVCVMGGVAPAQTTDAVAAALAEYVDANLLIYATSVPGVYSADPEEDADATKYDELSATDLVDVIADIDMDAGSSAPVDLLAAKIIQRAGMRTIVLDGTDPARIARAVRYGDHDGTDVIPEGVGEKPTYWADNEIGTEQR